MVNLQGGAAQGKVAILDHSVFSNYLIGNVNINHIKKGGEGKHIFTLKGNNQNLIPVLSGDCHSIPKHVLNATRT